MKLEEARAGFALTGSYCTFSKVMPAVERAAKEFHSVLPIWSEGCAHTDTRFGKAEDFRARIKEFCGTEPIATIAGAEPIGPKKLLDILIVAPCTGNTLAKLAYGITDTAVTMAVKAQLRNGRPVVLAVSTNDGLSVSLKNMGELLCRKDVYMVPFRQDDPTGKPRSLVADMTKIQETCAAALEGRQIQPVLLG